MIAGVDEAGRGPLAGPVVAAAVILDEAKPILGLNDSKLLTVRQRLKLADQIRKNAMAWGLGCADVEKIEQYNILQATLMAMQQAVWALPILPDLALIDGQHAPVLACQSQTIIKGDQLYAAISAASILAKVSRDELMVQLDRCYPQYGFAQHKGYGTLQHLRALQKYGPTPVHRASFAPVRKAIKLIENTLPV